MIFFFISAFERYFFHILSFSFHAACMNIKTYQSFLAKKVGKNPISFLYRAQGLNKALGNHIRVDMESDHRSRFALRSLYWPQSTKRDGKPIPRSFTVYV